jgi:hypothetical protein
MFNHDHSQPLWERQSFATFWGARLSQPAQRASTMLFSLLHPSASRRRNLPSKLDHLWGEAESLSLMPHQAKRQNKTLPGWEARPNVKGNLPGPMECGLTNPARAGMQQRQSAPHPPWSPWHFLHCGWQISDCGFKDRLKWPWACGAFNPQSAIRNPKSNKCLIKS